MGAGSMCVSAITFGKYFLSIFLTCQNAEDYVLVEKCIATCVIWATIAINSYSMKITKEVTKVFGYIKIISLCLICLIGFIALFNGSAVNTHLLSPANRNDQEFQIKISRKFLKNS